MKATSESNDLCIGVVGVGFIGLEHIRAVQKATRAMSVSLDEGKAFLVDIDEERAQRVAQAVGWSAGTIDDLREQSPTLVVVATPPAAHAEVVLALADTRCRFLVEKPLAPTLDEARLMAPLGSRIAVGFSQRFLPAVAYMKHAIDEGVVGAVSSVTAQYEVCQLPDEFGADWRLRREHGLGVLGDLGCHAIDMVQFVSGEAMTPLGSSLVQRPPLEDRMPSNEDVAECIFALERGGVGGLHLTRVSRGCSKPRQALRIVGEVATLEWHRRDLDTVLVERGSSITALDVTCGEQWNVKGQRPTPWAEQFSRQMAELIKWSMDGARGDALGDFEAGVDALRIAHNFDALGTQGSG